jgi:hypothetical protein
MNFIIERSCGAIDMVIGDQMDTIDGSLVISTHFLNHIVMYAPRTWSRVYIEDAAISTTPPPESETRRPRIPSRF